MSDVARAGRPPSIVAIGASTGGPQALIVLLSRLAPALQRLPNAAGRRAPPPVCVTLHMPRDLMPVLAAHVARRCGVATSVVDEPCPLCAGRVYFAPGDRPLGFEHGHDGSAMVIPGFATARRATAVDAMFAGAAAACGDAVLALVLSGMGEDGLAGSRAVVAAGGTVLVQDRASSAVWGMPGAVARAGLAALVLPPPSLAAEVIGRLGAARLGTAREETVRQGTAHLGTAYPGTAHPGTACLEPVPAAPAAARPIAGGLTWGTP